MSMSYTNRIHEERRLSGIIGEGSVKPSKEQLFRVKVLIEELKELRKNNPIQIFNMKNWCSIFKSTSKTLLLKLIGEAVKNPCGTSACLAGKAGLIPKIRRMGFKWDVISKPKRLGLPATAGFRYKNNIEEKAIKKFFGPMCYWEVFMDVYGINTLLQGIDALKKLHRRESKV